MRSRVSATGKHLLPNLFAQNAVATVICDFTDRYQRRVVEFFNINFSKIKYIIPNLFRVDEPAFATKECAPVTKFIIFVRKKKNEKLSRVRSRAVSSILRNN